jgi:hypothetical protein
MFATKRIQKVGNGVQSCGLRTTANHVELCTLLLPQCLQNAELQGAPQAGILQFADFIDYLW